MNTITHEDAFEVTTKNHGKVNVDAGTLVFPQVESVAEAIEFSGGEEKLVELFNDLVYGRAKNSALALVRNVAADGDVKEAVRRAIDYVKNYNPAVERVSKAAILGGVDELKAMKDQLAGMTAEQIMEVLAAKLKI